MERKNTANIIYKAYREFYEKEPDFSEENRRNITIEIQAMAYLLDKYGVNLGGARFSVEYKDLDLPMSMKIQDVIVSQLIGNKSDLTDDSIQFNPRANKIIGIVGNAICGVINKSNEPTETLRLLIFINFLKERVAPLSEDDRIKSLAGCEDQDLENAMNLYEIIKMEMCKNNFDKANIESITKMIDDSQKESEELNDEQSSEITPRITKESREIVAKSLLR